MQPVEDRHRLGRDEHATRPRGMRYDFPVFYDAVEERGFILYPGKLTEVPTFRVGCIGAIGVGEMRQAIHAIADAMRSLGIQSGRPAI